MQIVQADDVPAREVSGHRTGHIEFQQLMQGELGAPDNFEFSRVHNHGSFYSPRHRHNFEQVRFVLSGEFEYAARKRMKQGSVGFFPEGTPYGPQNVTECVTLVLQCGGPSGEGFMSYRQLHDGHLELAKLGTFKNGVFTRAGASNRAPGVRKNQDGYEAIWEHVNGRKLTYPKPRYSEPVIMYPDAIAWAPAGTRGVERKTCGIFDRNVTIEMMRLAPGARWAVEAPRAIQLLYTVAGRGTANGAAWRAECAIQVVRGERVEIAAAEETTLLHIGMAEIEARAATHRAA